MAQKFLILVVDDSHVVVDRLVPLLEELPNVERVLQAFNYDEGKKLLDENKIDVAILDIILPGKSGTDLLRNIKAEKYPVSIIIMMTDDPTEEKKKLNLALGADYFINKFNDFEEIPFIISKLGSI